jgi:glycosyltransferase involved in cell wall biosynthesis
MTLVSCIMPTAERRQFVPHATRLFFAQDYSNKELIIVDDGPESVADLIPDVSQVRYLRHEGRLSIGAKRNLACEAAHGEIILHWDDDDWYAPWRVRYQVQSLLHNNFDLCGLDRAYFVNAEAQEAWEYVYPKSTLPWVCGATLCYRKSFWQNHHFAEVNRGEDTRFVFSAHGVRVGILDDNRLFVARIHAGNTSTKRTRDRRWHSRPLQEVRSIMGADWEECFGGQRGLPLHAPSRKIGTALISAASGIGDILRVTPLVQAVYRLGYNVDVLIMPDDPAAAELLRGAPQIRRLFSYPELLNRCPPYRLAELAGRHYDLATFTQLSARLAKCVDARDRYMFDSTWRRDGDVASIARIAREIGWEAELPAPFAMKSARRFDLPRDTIALHPGCKANWPWKKWHGFDELGRFFPNVAVVGTISDRDNSHTYFARPFIWPAHVHDFTGKLDVLDTAALLSQCRALISIDSGLMHLGVALAIPTFGIFGITSPHRECIPSPFMIPITKQLPCEPACRRLAMARRDCEHHLECLKTLTAEEVATRVTTILAEQVNYPNVRATPIESPETITLNYYGEVFYASGYGQAARAYVHALHHAGVQIRVIDTGRKPHHIEDKLVTSLLGQHPNADFNLFHGVPSFWARAAYKLRNVIAMTVWEADQMPQTWRNPLSHAIDVWLPSAYNTEVFARDLAAAPYRLPHAFLPLRNATADAIRDAQLGVEPTDFVFYSIFEWQNRKNPYDLISVFLQTFPKESDAVLVIKTNAQAAREAYRVLAEFRAQSQSSGRVVLHCESFDEGRIQALQSRGDCYVSLHRGEGWGYPLFEAAGRGKPTIATAHGGPLDYLDSQRHWLVRCTASQVRQPYFLYTTSMRWAEPDLDHAREGLRWVYDHRGEARTAAEDAAHAIRRTYSIERIGEAAKARLVELKRSITKRSRAVVRQEHPSRAPAALPIPGEWYDADYFEHGLKSNWNDGYAWSSFSGLFGETAAFLHGMFPEATSYLDAGCAKGFLVHALRERGLDARGFDHSRWALEHALVDAKPFLELAALDTVTPDRAVDVLVAMSLLESLTEEQIRKFLPRALHWVRHAFFVTIPIQGSGRDCDLSHITVRDRQWWLERFAESGWQDYPLEETLKRHPLPAKMKWDVYVFNPGHE